MIVVGSVYGVGSLPTPAMRDLECCNLLDLDMSLQAQLYTLTIGPKGVHIAPKGKRKGHELSWRDLASGDAELNQSLVRSLTKQARRSGG